MTRSVNTVASKYRRKKILNSAKGYFGSNSKVFTVAKNYVEKSLLHSYIGRKRKKRDFRSLWIQRINAFARENNISYSKLIKKLSDNKININRKVLSDLSLNNPKSFKFIIDSIK